jgi:hypothetical protein
MHKPEVDRDDDILPEYDFTDAEVGKYAGRYARAFRTVRLDPDVADVFVTSEDVNEVLRPIASAIREREARAGLR